MLQRQPPNRRSGSIRCRARGHSRQSAPVELVPAFSSSPSLGMLAIASDAAHGRGQRQDPGRQGAACQVGACVGEIRYNMLSIDSGAFVECHCKHTDEPIEITEPRIKPAPQARRDVAPILGTWARHPPSVNTWPDPTTQHRQVVAATTIRGGAQEASGVKVAGNISAPMLAATLAADTCMESRARWA